MGSGFAKLFGRRRDPCQTEVTEETAAVTDTVVSHVHSAVTPLQSVLLSSSTVRAVPAVVPSFHNEYEDTRDDVVNEVQRRHFDELFSSWNEKFERKEKAKKEENE